MWRRTGILTGKQPDFGTEPYASSPRLSRLQLNERSKGVHASSQPITERTFDIHLISWAPRVADGPARLPRAPLHEKI